MVIFYCNYDITLLSHQNRKKLVEKASRSEGVYNRADEPSVTFCEKGAATKHTKKDRSINGLFDCSIVCCDVVEMRRVRVLCTHLQFDPKSTPFGTLTAPLAYKTVHRTVLFNRSCLSEFNSLSINNNNHAFGVVIVVGGDEES